MARLTGLEPATPGVTGRYSNQLSYNRASLNILRRCGASMPGVWGRQERTGKKCKENAFSFGCPMLTGPRRTTPIGYQSKLGLINCSHLAKLVQTHSELKTSTY